MTLRLMGKKRGMMQKFDDKGNVIVCTVIEVEPNVVTQVKTRETDGYQAIQLGFEKVLVKDARTLQKRFSKPLLGHFKKGSVEPRRHLLESRLDDVSSYSVGQEVSLKDFAGFDFVDACGTSKGKGYQGVMKKFHFAGGPASHGSGFHRHAGSTGQRSTPGRCFPNGKRASHMGHERVTVQNIRVVGIDLDENVILLEGAVPGPNNGLITLSAAVKKSHKKR